MNDCPFWDVQLLLPASNECAHHDTTMCIRCSWMRWYNLSLDCSHVIGWQTHLSVCKTLYSCAHFDAQFTIFNLDSNVICRANTSAWRENYKLLHFIFLFLLLWQCICMSRAELNWNALLKSFFILYLFRFSHFLSLFPGFSHDLNVNNTSHWRVFKPTANIEIFSESAFGLKWN